jgi:hypothetical protein
MLNPRLFANIAARIPLLFAPPENPANATGQCADCGQLFRIICSPAVKIDNRQASESSRGEMVASVASTIQPSFIAASLYDGASLMLVQPKSVVEVIIKIGHDLAGSKPFGKKSKARPVVGLGFPPCAAYS